MLMLKKQGFSAVLLIVILAVLGLGGYAVWKNKTITPPSALPEGEGTPTSPLGGGLEGVEDWKTYRNDEYGFSFDYPKEYVSSVSTKYPSQELSLTFVKNRNETGENFFSVALAKISNSSWTSDGKYLCDLCKFVKELSIPETKAKVVFLAGEGGNTKRVEILHNDLAFDVFQFVDGNEIVEDIAKTFKFTK